MAKTDIVGRGWAFPPGIGRHGGLALVSSSAELTQAIAIILGTTPGERVMRPAFGSQLHSLAFAPNNTQTAAQAERYVTEALGRWEPRIRLRDVTARPNPDSNQCLLIEIAYEVKATQDHRSLVYPFYLIPGE